MAMACDRLKGRARRQQNDMMSSATTKRYETRRQGRT
jgi:hypothetical protein